MAKRELHLLVTMDCERIRAESYRNDGTASWEMSERAITGLADMLAKEGLKGTFLPTPATAARQARLFEDVARAGFEVGMQFHCDSFRRGEYKQVLGAYDYGTQKEILTAAKADWQEALSIPLVTYRSGYLSANDHTFPILAQLGVKQTSISKPGRYLPDIAARWYGAVPYAHRASATCRLEAGDLDIVEVPVSSYPAERFAVKDHFDAKDPRPDNNYAPEVYRAIVHGCLWEMEILDPMVKTFVVLTHNTLDYTSDAEPRRKLMLDMLRHIKSKEEDGWRILPATLASVREALLS